MPSPVAHIGLAVCLQASLVRGPLLNRAVLVTAFASIAPDLDVLPLMLVENGIQWHRGPSHSLLGALLIGATIATLGRWWAPQLRDPRAWAAVVLATLLHVPLDWSTGEPNTPASYGVPAFWPWLDQKFIAASPWFGAFGIDRPGGLLHMFTPEAMAVYQREVFTVLIAAVLAWAVRSYGADTSVNA